MNLPPKASKILVDLELGPEIFDLNSREDSLRQKVSRSLRCSAAVLILLGYESSGPNHFEDWLDFLDFKGRGTVISAKVNQTSCVYRVESSAVVEQLSNWIDSRLVVTFLQPTKANGDIIYLPVKESRNLERDLVRSIFFCLSELKVPLHPTISLGQNSAAEDFNPLLAITG